MVRIRICSDCVSVDDDCKDDCETDGNSNDTLAVILCIHVSSEVLELQPDSAQHIYFSIVTSQLRKRSRSN